MGTFVFSASLLFVSQLGEKFIFQADLKKIRLFLLLRKNAIFELNNIKNEAYLPETDIILCGAKAKRK
jgi:hypothetical protein